MKVEREIVKVQRINTSLHRLHIIITKIIPTNIVQSVKVEKVVKVFEYHV